MQGKSAGQANETSTLQLRVLATTDLHMHLLGYDYYADRESHQVGLSRVASLIAEARREVRNTLLFDNGDTIQGSPLGDAVAAAFVMAGKASDAGPARTDPHPMIAAMNALGYDAGALGNHDLGFGLDFLQAALATASFPVLCANLVHRLGPTPRDDVLLLPPTTLLERELVDRAGILHTLRIGVVGVLPPQTTLWEQSQIGSKLSARCMIEAARAWLPSLKAAGADLVIALAHTGIDPRPAEAGMENAAYHLAALPEIDAIIAGHVHAVFPGPDFKSAPDLDPVAGRLHGKPAVMPGFWGSHLGVLDLVLGQDNGSWRIIDSKTDIRAIAGEDPDKKTPDMTAEAPEVVAAGKGAHDRTLQVIRQPVGSTKAPLHSFFALVADSPALRIVAEAQHWYLERLAKGTEWDGLPLLSAVSPFKAGGRAGPRNYTDIPVGLLTLRHIADLYLYPNSFAVVSVDGSALLEWLEMSASLFHGIEPGSRDARLIDEAFPSFNFDVISGLRYTIDLSVPPRYDADGKIRSPDHRRVTGVTHQGRPIRADERALVATNDYRAAGGGYFAALRNAQTVLAPAETNRDILTRFVRETGPVRVPDQPIWGFADLPGTSVLFDSAPKAVSHLPDPARSRIEPVGASEAGFARYRLHL